MPITAPECYDGRAFESATLNAAGAADVTALASDCDAWKEKAEAFGEQPGVLPTAIKTGNDVAEGGDESAKIVADLHEKMLNGQGHSSQFFNALTHPLDGFGNR